MKYRVYFTTKAQPSFWEKKFFNTVAARDEWLDKEDDNLVQIEIEKHEEATPEKD